MTDQTVQPPTTTAIPSRRAIDAYVAGVNGSSAYHRARHEVWSAIRDRYELLTGERWAPTLAAERQQRQQRHDAAMETLGDAIEWAEILDRHVPSQQGSGLERTYFRDQAFEALPRTAA